MSIISDLSQRFGEAFAATGFDAAWGQVVPSQRPELAQYQWPSMWRTLSSSSSSSSMTGA